MRLRFPSPTPFARGLTARLCARAYPGGAEYDTHDTAQGVTRGVSAYASPYLMRCHAVS